MARKSSSKQAVAGLYEDLFPAKPIVEVEIAPELSTRVDKKRGIKKRMSRSELEPWADNPRTRRSEADLSEMGASLEEHGQLQALLVRPHPDPEKRSRGISQIVAGVTRFLAGAAPYGDFPIYDVDEREMNDREALDAAYAENAKRNDMPLLDHARYFSKRMAMEGADEDSLRKVANASKFSHERIRQFVGLLSLPEPILSEFEALELNEKHGRALLSLKEFPQAQLSLLRQIERGALSGNAALTRARVMFVDEMEAEATGQGKQAILPSSPAENPAITRQSGNADDADFAENDAALASRDHETRGQKAGTGGVGQSAPVSLGVGFATASSEGQNLKPAGTKTDFVDDELRPAVASLRALVGKLRDLTPLSEDAENRLEKLLTPIEAASTEIFNAIDFSRKLREIDENHAKNDEKTTKNDDL